MGVFQIVNVSSIAIASFLGLHFFFRGKRENIVLGLCLVFIAFSVLASELLHPLLFILSSPFLLAPLLLQFLFAIIQKPASTTRKSQWLFTFAAADALVVMLFPDSELRALISALLSSAFNLIVFSWILLELKRHSRTIESIFSATEGKRLLWLRNLTWIQLAFSVLWLLDDSLYLTLGTNPISELCSQISLFTTFLTIVWIGFAGLRQLQIYDAPADALLTSPHPSPAEIPHLEKRYSQIVTVIERDKLFLNKNLSLQDLATELQLKGKDLSQIINQGFHANFYHFINHFRIQYFKSLVQEGKHQQMTLEGLAKEVGFNSKSTFYAAFKKNEGMTPRAYILQQK